MNLEKAIIDLSIQREVKRRLSKNQEADALGLGIEALKRVQEQREGLFRPRQKLLPGETEN